MCRVGAVVLDSATRQLMFDAGSRIGLTPIEFKLLRCLMQRPGDFFALDELLEHVGRYPPQTGGPEIVPAHVSNVRRKLRCAGEHLQLLRTLPHRGTRSLRQ